MIVHIGYHKTGTTFLQNKIFPNLEGIQFYGYMNGEDPMEGFIENSSLDIDIEYFQKRIKEIQAENLLYSNENLIGPLFYMTGLGKVEIARNLKKIGATKIIITIRNQFELLDSIYRQYIQEGGVAKFDFFIGDWRFSFNTKHLQFYELINLYQELYGKENVLVLLNEEIRNEEANTIKKIEAFTGSTYKEPEKKLNPKKANISISNGSIHLLRIVNHFFRSHHRPSNIILPFFIRTFFFRYILQRFLDPYLISKVYGKKSFVSERTKKELYNNFAKDNRRIEQDMGLELSKYNYPL